MITLFSTTKEFQGRNAVNQRNALRSWQANDFGVQIILFGECPGVGAVSSELDIVHVKETATSQNGVPLIGAMFEAAAELAAHDICCFVNSDIILPSAFFRCVESIHKRELQRYLIAGQRDDVWIDEEMTFDTAWESRLRGRYGAALTEHCCAGMDYFVYPKNQYRPGEIPRLLVGRPGWDLWMIYHARRQGYKTIDLTPSLKVIHQNHDYAHKPKQYASIVDDPEAQTNLANLPKQRYAFTLLACNYVYRNGTLAANRARGDRWESYRIERALGNRVPWMDQIRAGWTRVRQKLARAA